MTPEDKQEIEWHLKTVLDIVQQMSTIINILTERTIALEEENRELTTKLELIEFTLLQPSGEACGMPDSSLWDKAPEHRA
jgi:hypothetical protein